MRGYWLDIHPLDRDVLGRVQTVKQVSGHFISSAEEIVYKKELGVQKKDVMFSDICARLPLTWPDEKAVLKRRFARLEAYAQQRLLAGNFVKHGLQAAFMIDVVPLAICLPDASLAQTVLVNQESNLGGEFVPWGRYVGRVFVTLGSVRSRPLLEKSVENSMYRNIGF